MRIARGRKMLSNSLNFRFTLKVRKLWRRIRNHFPSKLPTKGSKEFDEWSEDLFRSFDLPDNPSYRHAVASMILHLGPQTTSKAKSYFAISIRKAMANQIAFEKIQEYKKAEEKEAAPSEEVHGNKEDRPRSRVN